MVITFIMDQYTSTTNGTTVTAMRFAEVLRKKGHTVRVVAARPSGDVEVDEKDVYFVDEFHLPVFDGVVKSQGFAFAKPDVEVLKKAIEGSDVVHLLLPFPIQRQARLIAKDLGIATTAAFHLQPENITYTIYMGKSKWLNNCIYHYFRKSFYKYINHVHCPSVMIRDQLVKHKYKNNLHVISNGVAPAFVHLENVERPERFKDKFIILMIGRLSREKRQDLLIKAIGASKYNDKIQLVLCGRGPWKDHLTSLSKKYLKNKVEFMFLPQDELVKLINYSDLYVHSSDAEIEAISCMESFTCGLVPIISDSKYTATKQFAQDEHCLFKNGDYLSLRDRIDYFYENPEHLKKLSKIYLEYAKQYTLNYCVDKFEDVFVQAIKDNEEYKRKHGSLPSTKKEHKTLKALNKKIVKQLKKAAKKNVLRETNGDISLDKYHSQEVRIDEK